MTLIRAAWTALCARLADLLDGPPELDPEAHVLGCGECNEWIEMWISSPELIRQVRKAFDEAREHQGVPW